MPSEITPETNVYKLVSFFSDFFLVSVHSFLSKFSYIYIYIYPHTISLDFLISPISTILFTNPFPPPPVMPSSVLCIPQFYIRFSLWWRTYGWLGSIVLSLLVSPQPGLSEQPRDTIADYPVVGVIASTGIIWTARRHLEPIRLHCPVVGALTSTGIIWAIPGRNDVGAYQSDRSTSRLIYFVPYIRIVRYLEKILTTIFLYIYRFFGKENGKNQDPGGKKCWRWAKIMQFSERESSYSRTGCPRSPHPPTDHLDTFVNKTRCPMTALNISKFDLEENTGYLR